MLPEDNEHQQIKDLLLENQRLLGENNELLKKIRRNAVWAFWMRLVWTLILLGVPFVLYYFVIEPYFDSLGSSFQTFQAGLQEVPGWKQFYEAMGAGSNSGE